MRMKAAAPPTAAPAMVPDETSRAMMTWSLAVRSCDMMGEIEVEDDVDLRISKWVGRCQANGSVSQLTED
jgi:hypothetical protein